MRSAEGRRRFLLAAVALGLSGLAGCRSAVGPVTGSAVSASLAGVNEPANRQRIEELLTSEAVVRSTRELTRAAVDAALAELASDERQARAKQLASDFARDLGPALGTMIDKDVLPRVQDGLAASVRTVLDQALSDESRKRTSAFTAGVARQTMAAVQPQIASLADSVSRSLQQALRTTLTQDLSPALGHALDANGPAISRVMRAGTEGALLGVADAMKGPFGEALRNERKAAFAEVEAAAAGEHKAWHDELQRDLDESRRWFRTLVVMAAVGSVLMLGVGILLWRLMLENRRLRGSSS